MKGLTLNDSERNDFVLECYVYGAIDRDELNRWAEHIMCTEAEYPTYIVDLYEFHDSKPRVQQVVGFGGGLGASDRRAVQALMQLAFDRHAVRNDNVAEKVLQSPTYASVETLARFNAAFPFLSAVPIPATRWPTAIGNG
jgi:hypothetical protein